MKQQKNRHEPVRKDKHNVDSQSTSVRPPTDRLKRYRRRDRDRDKPHECSNGVPDRLSGDGSIHKAGGMGCDYWINRRKGGDNERIRERRTDKLGKGHDGG